ncbi:hypothetical protein BDV12DRAFT_147297 [Aspergillus spectabilis]
MSLLTLPTELLCLLPLYLDNIESFTSASSTCRTLRAAFLTTHPSTILRLAASSSPTFFSPHPYFLIAATARSVSNWATSPGHPDRITALRRAFHGGIYALYDFCIEHGSLTLDRIRETHLARFAIINPLSDKIDKMAGKQWSKTPRFWHGGVSEAVTLYTDSDRAAFQVIIYGELFGGAIDAFLDSGEGEGGGLRGLDMDARLDFLTYCLPDDTEPNHPGDDNPTQFSYYEDQRALRHIVKCNRWRRMWGAAIREDIDAGFEDEGGRDEGWEKKLLRDALMVQGLRGMEMVTRKAGVDLSAGCLDKARWVWERIRKLKKEPEVRMMGRRANLKVSVVPDPVRELTVVYGGQWASSV